MIRLKSQKDIERLAEGGKILAEVLDVLEKEVVVGVKPTELDRMAQELTAKENCQPSFLNYAPKGHRPYPAALCVSVNDAVVHGLPTDEPLQEGDVVGIDFGLIYKDKYFLDSARTIGVGKVSDEASKLMEATKGALSRGIEASQAGGTVGDIGAAIQGYAEGNGFQVVRQLVGHGVGFGVHEPPQVPNFGAAGTGAKMESGLVIAIEPMLAVGDATVDTGDDGWSVKVKTGNLTAHQEHTVAVTDSGPRVLTVLS